MLAFRQHSSVCDTQIASDNDSILLLGKVKHDVVRRAGKAFVLHAGDLMAHLLQENA